MHSDHAAAARRAVPRTGVHSIDEEALLMFSCLSRVEVSLARAFAEQKTKKAQTMSGPNSERVDITHRTSMGRTFDDIDVAAATPDAVEERVFHSDASVASASLVRLSQHVAMSLKEMEHYSSENAELKSKLAEAEQEVVRLRTRLELVEKTLSERDNPEALFRAYKDTWSRQHADGQSKANASHAEKEAALERFIDKSTSAGSRSQNVSTFRLMYHTAEQLLQEEFKPDDQAIDRMISIFARAPQDGKHPQDGKKKKKGPGDALATRLATLSSPPPGLLSLRSPANDNSPTLGKGADDSPRSFADDLDEDLEDGDFGGADEAMSLLDKVNVNQIIAPPPETLAEAQKKAKTFIQQLKSLDFPKAQKTRLEDFDADGTELDMASVQKAAVARQKRAVNKSSQSVKSAALIVTYYMNSNTRKITKLDDSGTLMHQLKNVVVEAPTQYASLVIDMASAVGKSDVISEQARKIKMSTIWEEITKYEQPVVRIIAALGPEEGVSAQQEWWQHDPREVEDYKVTLTANADPKARERISKLKFFRNGGGPMDENVTFWTAKDHSQIDSEPKLVTTHQAPGIIRFIASSFGKDDKRWLSPVQNGHIRCMASSMVDACRPDALIMPFVDNRNPFFMTEDAAFSSVTISFDHVVIVPTGYSMSSVHPITGGLFPRSWKLEASLDQKKWTLLRQHDDDETLSRYNPTFYWDLPKVSKGEPYFQHFRFTQLKANACGSHNFCISAIEFYGRMMFVDKLVIESSATLPRTRMAKVGFAAFSPLPAPKAVEAAKKKK